MHIGIDVDGVLRKLVESIRNEYVKENPDSNSKLLSVDELCYWDIRKLAPNDELGLGKKVQNFALNDPETSFRCFRNANVYPGSVKGMRKLYHDAQHNDHTVSICSSQKSPWQRKATVQWLSEHEVPCDSVILTGDGKGHFGLDVIFDDRVKNCKSVEQNGGTGVLKSMGYNQNSFENSDFVDIRFDSIDEFRNFVLDRS